MILVGVAAHLNREDRDFSEDSIGEQLRKNVSEEMIAESDHEVEDEEMEEEEKTHVRAMDEIPPKLLEGL